MNGGDRFFDSVHRAERDAIKAAVGDCSGLSILNAGSRLDLRPCPDGTSLTDLPLTEQPFPLPAWSFDRAVSAQVLSHMAGVDRRSAYLREVTRILKPDGLFIATAMHFSFRFRQKGALKEGWSNGTYYHRYFPEEFRSELETYFTVERMHGFWIYLPKTYSFYMSLGRYNVYWERILRDLPLSLKYGKFLLAVCRPREALSCRQEGTA